MFVDGDCAYRFSKGVRVFQGLADGLELPSAAIAALGHSSTVSGLHLVQRHLCGHHREVQIFDNYIAGHWSALGATPVAAALEQPKCCCTASWGSFAERGLAELNMGRDHRRCRGRLSNAVAAAQEERCRKSG